MSARSFSGRFDALRRDVRTASRSMRSVPGTTASVLLTLALVIGANVAIFSMLSASGYRRLPYPDQDRVVYLYGRGVDLPLMDGLTGTAGLVDGAAAIRLRRTVVSGAIPPEEVGGLAVSRGFFRMLGVRPAHGRAFSDQEYDEGLPVVMVSGPLWERLQPEGGTPEGATLRIDGVPHTVVGILPTGLETAIRTGVFPILYPAHFAPGDPVSILARLAPGVGTRTLRERLDLLGRPPGLEGGAGYSSAESIRIQTVPEMLLGDSRQFLLILQICALAALLIGLANVTNILLTRALARGREFAVRGALGAARKDLARQMVVETVLTTLIGGIGGLLVGAGLLGWLRSSTPVYMLQHAAPIELSVPIVLAVLLVALCAGMVLGGMTALLAGRLTGIGFLRGGRTTSGAGRSVGRLRAALVAVEFALALGLVVASGTATETFLRLRPDAPGFDPEGKSVFTLNLPPERFPTIDASRSVLERLCDGLRAIPGVERVTYVNDLPIGGSYWVTAGRADGTAETASSNLYLFSAQPDYAEILSIPLIRGAPFTQARAGEGRAWINQRAAESLWPDQDPVGRRLTLDDRGASLRLLVAGVLGDTRMSIASTEPSPCVYVPYGEVSDRRATMVLVTPRVPEGLATSVADVVSALAPGIPVQDFGTIEERHEEMERLPAFAMQAVTLSGVLALLLAVIGVFGLLSYATRLRTREFGIRVAVGALPSDLVRNVLGRSLRLAAGGSVLGVLFAVWLHAGLRSRLIGIRGLSPTLVVSAAAVLVLSSLLAGWVPARRAGRLDPALVLREE